jgi:hypothetical protein
MADKKLSPVVKGIIWISTIAVIGVAGYFAYQGFQKWKVKRDAESNEDADVTPPNDSSITPKDTSTPADVKAKSFADVKVALGSGAKDMTDYVKLTAAPETFGLSSGDIGGNIMAKFQNDGGYRLYVIPKGTKETKLLHGGLYWNGGKSLKVFNDYLRGGANKNLVVSSTSPINALIKASKA